MDKLTQYRYLIQRVLEKYSQVKPANGEIEVYKFFDHQDDHYQVFHAGWKGASHFGKERKIIREL